MFPKLAIPNTNTELQILNRSLLRNDAYEVYLRNLGFRNTEELFLGLSEATEIDSRSVTCQTEHMTSDIPTLTPGGTEVGRGYPNHKASTVKTKEVWEKETKTKSKNQVRRGS